MTRRSSWIINLVYRKVVFLSKLALRWVSEFCTGRPTSRVAQGEYLEVGSKKLAQCFPSGTMQFLNRHTSQYQIRWKHFVCTRFPVRLCFALAGNPTIHSRLTHGIHVGPLWRNWTTIIKNTICNREPFAQSINDGIVAILNRCSNPSKCWHLKIRSCIPCK